MGSQIVGMLGVRKFWLVGFRNGKICDKGLQLHQTNTLNTEGLSCKRSFKLLHFVWKLTGLAGQV